MDYLPAIDRRTYSWTRGLLRPMGKQAFGSGVYGTAGEARAIPSHRSSPSFPDFGVVGPERAGIEWSKWYATIVLRIPPLPLGVSLHHGALDLLSRGLDGRIPLCALRDGRLILQFRVHDNGPDSHQLLQDVASRLPGLLAAGPADVELSYINYAEEHEPGDRGH